MTDKTKASDAKVTDATKEAPKPADAAKADKSRDDAAIFQQGRTAALGSISEEDAPYDKSNPAHRVWLKGFKSVER